MSEIKIIAPGLLTTVQDLGRRGYEKFGMSVSGAMDEYAFRAANILAGNDENAGALEITLSGPKIEFLESGNVAVTGANLSPMLDGVPVPMWECFFVAKGQILSFGPLICGARAYLAIAGGIDAPLVMGSRATYIKAGIGGFSGRALKAGDIIPFGKPAGNPLAQRLPEAYIPDYSAATEIGVILGPQKESFTDRGISDFLSGTYEVSAQSDRMGYRLNGPPIAHKNGPDIISDGIVKGSVQVPGNGQPIILMSDRQTAGGYTKIATVISVDLPKIAQAKPGDKIRFRQVSAEYAQKMYISRENALEEMKNGGFSGKISAAYNVILGQKPYFVKITEI